MPSKRVQANCRECGEDFICFQSQMPRTFCSDVCMKANRLRLRLAKPAVQSRDRLPDGWIVSGRKRFGKVVYFMTTLHL